MKKFIQKIRSKGKEHTHKMAIVFAAISTIIVIVVWFVLVTPFSNDGPVVADPNAPDIKAFLIEAGAQINQIVTSVEETSESFQEVLELAKEENE